MVGEGLAVDQNQGGDAAGRDDCTRHHCLARARWGDQQTEVVTAQVVDRGLLSRRELSGERHLVRFADGAFVGDVGFASRLADDRGSCLEEATGEDEVVIEGLVVGGDDPRHVPGRLAATLTGVELGGTAAGVGDI